MDGGWDCSGRSRIFLRSANSQSGCANLLFCIFFAENGLKMKEFGSRRGRVSLAPPWIRQWIDIDISVFDFMKHIGVRQTTVAAPRYPRGSANSWMGSANLLFCKFFSKNCMKLKKFEPGRASLAAHLDPLLNNDHWSERRNRWNRWSLRSFTILRNHNLQFFRTRF